MFGLSEWNVVKVGTREECLEYAREGDVGIFFKPMKAIPLSGKDIGIIGIAPLRMEFGEGYYL